jgi:D-alanyl-D-alanine carboxypeptidase
VLVLGSASLSGVAGAATPHGQTAAAAGLTAQLKSRLASTLRTSWATTWAPGVVAGVWIGNRRWTSILGSTQRAAGPRPVLGDHTRIGSVTKTMVGTLILELVDQHKLALDEAVQRWFPKLPDAQNITIRDLGDMSSGIASYTTDPKIVDRYFARPRTIWKPNQLIAGGARLSRLFAPGKGFNYSDTNFVMLGQIAERVTGKPLAELLRSMVYKPLGMRQSSYPTGNSLPSPFWRGSTIQGSEAGNVLDATGWSPTFAAGAGQAISTLGDLGRWGHALGTGQLLTPATQDARLIPNQASEAGGRAYLFALGSDHGWLGHEGSIPGYNTDVQYLPARNATIVVLANTDISNAQGHSPVSTIFSALAQVIDPAHAPAR